MFGNKDKKNKATRKLKTLKIKGYEFYKYISKFR